MEWGGATETECMPNLGGVVSKVSDSKWNTGKGFSKPNSELFPSQSFSESE